MNTHIPRFMGLRASGRSAKKSPRAENPSNNLQLDTNADLNGDSVTLSSSPKSRKSGHAFRQGALMSAFSALPGVGAFSSMLVTAMTSPEKSSGAKKAFPLNILGSTALGVGIAQGNAPAIIVGGLAMLGGGALTGRDVYNLLD